jgi:hypothetical protein
MNRVTTILAILAVSLVVPTAQSSITVATFDDPAMNSTTPLFTVDFMVGAYGTISGNWFGTNLDLDVLSSTIYNDAKFRMTNLNLTAETDSMLGTKTDGGTIYFLSATDDHLLQIEFDSAWFTTWGIGSGEAILLSNNVTITGQALGGLVLSEESFAFSFTNHAPLRGSFKEGFTATASFTSSAIPEPATILLLGVGVLSAGRRSRHKSRSK